MVESPVNTSEGVSWFTTARALITHPLLHLNARLDGGKTENVLCGKLPINPLHQQLQLERAGGLQVVLTAALPPSSGSESFTPVVIRPWQLLLWR